MLSFSSRVSVLASLIVFALLSISGCDQRSTKDQPAAITTTSPFPTAAATSDPSPTPPIPIRVEDVSVECRPAVINVNYAMAALAKYESETPESSQATSDSGRALNLALADIDAGESKLKRCSAQSVNTAFAYADARIYLTFNLDFGLAPDDVARAANDISKLRSSGFDRVHPREFGAIQTQLMKAQAILNGN